MRWFRDTCRDKHRTVHMDVRLAQELIDASENKVTLAFKKIKK